MGGVNASPSVAVSETGLPVKEKMVIELQKMTSADRRINDIFFKAMFFFWINITQCLVRLFK